jgi:hypothetical protein
VGGAVRTVEEARAIAERAGVRLPPWIKIVVDPTMNEADGYAQYTLQSAPNGRSVTAWADLTCGESVVVRVAPSDEKIVAIFEHESWELSGLQRSVEANQSMTAQGVQRLIDESSHTNLHGQGWALADKRVAIFRATDPAQRMVLQAQYDALVERYTFKNGW